jgi:hypothetical protein
MPAKKQTKAQYMAKVEQRVYHLYYFRGIDKPKEIAEILVREGTMETTDESLESATRLVREHLRNVKASIAGERKRDTSVVTDDLDVLERELAELQKQHARQEVIAAGEPCEMCAVSRLRVEECTMPECLALGKHRSFIGPAIGITLADTPQGPITSYKALWPAGVRQKASKDASILAEKISVLEIKVADRRRKQDEAVKDGAGKTGPDVFNIVTTGQPMNELITANATGGTEAKPN